MIDNSTQPAQHLPAPDPDLESLNSMVGTWKLSGGVDGMVRFEWMEGCFFMIQHVDLVQNGFKIKGMEIIGHLRGFDEQPSKEIRSRFYDSIGNTFDYVYEPRDDGLIIWAGEKNSGAYCEGKTSEDGNSFLAEWHYPDGGGYKVVGEKVN